VTNFARAFKSLYDQFHAIGRPVDRWHEQSALVPLWPRCDFSSFSSN
jgi:hypothetical protein